MAEPALDSTLIAEGSRPARRPEPRLEPKPEPEETRPPPAPDRQRTSKRRDTRRLGRGERRLIDASESTLTRFSATLRLPRGILLGRLGYALRQSVSHLGLVPGSTVGLGGRAVLAPLCTPADPWPGDADSGMALVGGRYRFVGLTLSDPDPLWAPPGADKDWLRELHSFCWLRDLRAAAIDPARRHARELTADWLVNCEGWSPLPWEPLVLSRRLTHWLGQYDFFAASAEPDFTQALLASAQRQARYLAAVLPAGLAGASLICAIKGLIIAGACLPDTEVALRRGLVLLRRQLARQVLPDGGHIERSPARHLAVLRDLIDIRSVLSVAGRDGPAELEAAIQAMTPMLRLFLHGDRSLALFNGSGQERDYKIDLVLQRADGGSRALSQAPNSGFQRLQAGRTVAVVDAGAPAPAGYDSRAHAGTLSFEMSVGKERLITNCGAPGVGAAVQALPAAWKRLMRATAAHSTLTIDDSNSAWLGASSFGAAACGHGAGLAERPQAVTCRREQTDGTILLDMSHDGYRTTHGVIHHRRLFLSATGDDLRGADSLEPVAVVHRGRRHRFAVRFHLHPGVQASLLQDKHTVLLRLPKGGVWRLHSDAPVVELEESVFVGSGPPRRCEQVVLSGSFCNEPVLVRWALRREG